MAISKLLADAVRARAKNMLGNQKWVDYGQEFGKQLGIEKAFLAGAIDAMIFDEAVGLTPRRIPTHADRKSLIEEILKNFPTD